MVSFSDGKESSKEEVSIHFSVSTWQKKRVMDQIEYLRLLAAQLADEMKPILAITEVTRSSVLLGHYTEAAVRRLAHRVVQPMRICSGAVINHPMPKKLQQLDLIIWAPDPAPAIFEVEGFGLVPRSSVFGVLEIKRSNYGVKAIRSIEKVLKGVADRSLVSDKNGAIADQRDPGLGVICVLDKPVTDELQSLLDSGKVVAIFDKVGDKVTPRSKNIFDLVNFLHFVGWRYRVASSRPGFTQIITDGL